MTPERFPNRPDWTLAGSVLLHRCVLAGHVEEYFYHRFVAASAAAAGAGRVVWRVRVLGPWDPAESWASDQFLPANGRVPLRLDVPVEGAGRAAYEAFRDGVRRAFADSRQVTADRRYASGDSVSVRVDGIDDR